MSPTTSRATRAMHHLQGYQQHLRQYLAHLRHCGCDALRTPPLVPWGPQKGLFSSASLRWGARAPMPAVVGVPCYAGLCQNTHMHSCSQCNPSTMELPQLNQ